MKFKIHSAHSTFYVVIDKESSVLNIWLIERFFKHILKATERHIHTNTIDCHTWCCFYAGIFSLDAHHVHRTTLSQNWHWLYPYLPYINEIYWIFTTYHVTCWCANSFNCYRIIFNKKKKNKKRISWFRSKISLNIGYMAWMCDGMCFVLHKMCILNLHK